MTENKSDSNAELVTFTSTPPEFRIAAPLPQNLLVLPVASGSPVQSPAIVPRQEWTGTVTRFARTVKADWDALPEPKPTMAAFTRLRCEQWERSEHRRFSPDSIKSLLRKAKYKAEGRPL